MIDLKYKEKVAVVTGAASGIGKATAEQLVKLGAKVYAMDINPITIEGLEKKIIVDLSNKDSIDKAFSEVPKHIDCFFGVAGVSAPTISLLKAVTINFISNKYICETILSERMVSGDAICLVNSAAGLGWQYEKNIKYYKAAVEAESWDAAVTEIDKLGFSSLPGSLGYSLSKMALNFETARLQKILASKGIRVNSIAPGHVETSMGKIDETTDPSTAKTLTAYNGYAGRAAQPEEMAYPMLFLNSPYASFISGAMLDIDYGCAVEINIGVRSNPSGEDLDTFFSYFK